METDGLCGWTMFAVILSPAQIIADIMSEDRNPEKQTSDSPGVRVPPPLIFAVGFAAGLILEWLLPLRFFTPAPFKFTGWLLAVISGMLALWAGWTMHRTGTTIKTHRPTSSLVTSGPFRFTRNPLYLSLVLLSISAALYFDVDWALVILVPVVFIVQEYVIRREERHLEARFGTDYLEYKKKVRRWL